MRERIEEIRKYALNREPTPDELLADMNKAMLAGTKTEACSSGEIISVKGKRYRYHPGFWVMFAGYTTRPSIWPENG